MNFTPLEESFNYNSSIQPFQLQAKFSITCIFCTNSNTKGLNQEGSFRQCLNCRKQFQCQVQPVNNIYSVPSLVPIKPPSTFQTFQRPLFIEPQQQQQQQQQFLFPNNIYK
jgi:hypothetical protein